MERWLAEMAHTWQEEEVTFILQKLLAMELTTVDCAVAMFVDAAELGVARQVLQAVDRPVIHVVQVRSENLYERYLRSKALLPPVEYRVVGEKAASNSRVWPAHVSFPAPTFLTMTGPQRQSRDFTGSPAYDVVARGPTGAALFPRQRSSVTFRWLYRQFFTRGNDKQAVVLSLSMNTGSSLLAAAAEGVHGIGYEVNTEYAAAAKRRIATFAHQEEMRWEARGTRDLEAARAYLEGVAAGLPDSRRSCPPWEWRRMKPLGPSLKLSMMSSWWEQCVPAAVR